MKGIISSIGLVLIFIICSANEFWLEPDRFHYEVGEQIKVDFREGENFDGQHWDMTRNKAELMQWYSVLGVKDITKSVTPTTRNNFSMKFGVPGTQLFVMRSNPIQAELDAEKFNAYLEEEGLDEIVDLRRKANESSDSAKETYTCFAKMLVQVGEIEDDTYKKKANLRLEIIPDKNPVTLLSGDYLKCLVLFEGKPLPHALVKVWSRLNHTTFLQNIYTEKDGTINFPISTKGAWMVSTVKMVRSEKAGTEWNGFRSSLVFGI